jgi:hypothetical protein
MKTTTVKMRVCDSFGLRVRNRGRDAMLTPNTRLTAEPANPPERGDFGTLYDGNNNGAPSRGVDVKAVWDSLVVGLSSLSQADQYEIRKRMLKYAGAAPPASSTGAAGVTSLDGQTFATPANRQIAMETARIREVQDANREFWDRQVP